MTGARTHPPTTADAARKGRRRQSSNPERGTAGILAMLAALGRERAELEERRRRAEGETTEAIARAQQAGATGQEIARALGISRQRVYDILSKRRRT